MGLTELLFRGCLSPRAGFTSPARHRGAGGVHPRSRLDFFDFGSAPSGPRGEGEGESRGGRVPGRFPVGRAERRRDRPCEAGAKRPAGRKKHDFTLFYKTPLLRGVRNV